jgi:hypothetical protein
MAAAQQFGLQSKFKLLLFFYQVWSVRESVYGFYLPSELTEWLSWLDVLSFDVGSFIFPSWTCVGGLAMQLIFNGLWPLLLIAVAALGLLMIAAVHKVGCRAAMLRTLEAFVFISFCVLPSITRTLFLAFQCESYGYDDLTDEAPKAYLTASPNIACTADDEHTRIIILAGVFILVWPVAMPLLYALLLHRCRRAILNHQPTALSGAIHFLWSEYNDENYWYELLALGQKLVLTNVLLFVNIGGGSDQILRPLIGMLIALLGLTLQFIVQPFRKQSDDDMSCAVQLMLVLFFTLGIMINICDKGSCSDLVGLNDAYEVSVVMICAGLLVLLVPICMFIRQLLLARAVPILRDASTMEPPSLLLGKGQRYHLFLSHIWSTGQDQCAVIKRQLQLLLPGVVIFLDVDDLKDIGDLESYVRATGVMLFFLSKKVLRVTQLLARDQELARAGEASRPGAGAAGRQGRRTTRCHQGRVPRRPDESKDL